MILLYNSTLIRKVMQRISVQIIKYRMKLMQSKMKQLIQYLITTILDQEVILHLSIKQIINRIRVSKSSSSKTALRSREQPSSVFFSSIRQSKSQFLKSRRLLLRNLKLSMMMKALMKTKTKNKRTFKVRIAMNQSYKKKINENSSISSNRL